MPHDTETTAREVRENPKFDSRANGSEESKGGQPRCTPILNNAH